MTSLKILFICLFSLLAFFDSYCQDVGEIPYNDSTILYKTIREWKDSGGVGSIFVAPIHHKGRLFFQSFKRELSLKDSNTLRTLDSIAKFLRKEPDLIVEVGLHLSIRHPEGFDCHGGMCKQVVYYLEKKGVKPEQLLWETYCDKKPFLIGKDSTKFSRTKDFWIKDHNINYRMEFKKLDKGKENK